MSRFTSVPTVLLSLAIVLLPGVTQATAAGATSLPGVRWRFVTGGRPLLAAPAVGHDGTVYAAAGDGTLYALAPDGRIRWRLSTGLAGLAATTTATTAVKPAIGPDGASYWSIGGGIVAVDAGGRLRWVFLASGAGAPVFSRGRVLVVAGMYLYAIATTGPQAGQRLWRAAVESEETAGEPAPAVGPDGTAYVAASNGYLYAIGPNGLRRWAAHIGVPLTFSPAVGLNGDVYLDAFANGHGTLYAFSPRGARRWRLSIPVGGDVVRGPTGIVYVAAHLLLAVSPQGRILWRRTVDAAAPVTTDGALVVVPTLAPAGLLALDDKGATRWHMSLPAATLGPVAHGKAGELYSSDYTGTLTALVPGLHKGGRLIKSPAPAAPVDLGAVNVPFALHHGAMAWRVTLARTVENSRDGGKHWRTVLTPGQSSADARTGRYHNARYADITFLAEDPHDPRALYVGTVGTLGDYTTGGSGGADGGLYYSPTGTSSWRHPTDGLPYTYEPRLRVPTFGIQSLVFDPVHRDILYAQTPPSFGSPGRDAGLYKSVDGGKHWREATRGLRATIRGNALLGPYRAFLPGPLLVDPARPSVLFLITPNGLYRSTDAAGNWARVGAVRYDDPASVAVRPGPRGIVRVYTDRGVYRSADFGAHWTVESR